MIAAIFWAAGVGLLVNETGCPTRSQTEVYVFHHENVLGTALELTVRAVDADGARRAEELALAEIDRLSGILSNYNAQSELMRWRAAGANDWRASDELIEVLSAAKHWHVASQGAFDVRLAPLIELWRTATQTGQLPPSGELARARSQMIQTDWTIDLTKGIVRLRGGGPLTLDGIAKGYIVERACAAAFRPELGVCAVLVNLGGDVCARGDELQPLGLAEPGNASEAAPVVAMVRLRGASMATSGSAHRGFRVGDRWFSHIIDPRTGSPSELALGATVIAPRGIDADALATICNILPAEDALHLVDAVPGAACRITAMDGKVATSARWSEFAIAAPLAAEGANAPRQDRSEQTWADTHELAIDFEINRPDVQGRYRRPYVVIWIENSEGIAIRTLLLWVSFGGAGFEQWIPDLSRWYRGDAKQNSSQRKNLVQTIGRSTRPPGKYNVVWDGTDDSGKPAPQGEYTVLIEAAREHGTHQLMRKTVSIGPRESTEELEGNVEIKSARISLRRKSTQK